MAEIAETGFQKVNKRNTYIIGTNFYLIKVLCKAIVEVIIVVDYAPQINLELLKE